MPSHALPLFSTGTFAAGALALLIALTTPVARAQNSRPASPACPPMLQHTFPRLQDERPQALCQYAGKVLLVVNTASYCSFTPQYTGLEALYARYKDRGLVVLGFPSNDFEQETGSNRQIADFCENTFGVKFPMFSKTVVTGPRAVLFYKQLAAQSGQGPRWNFHKYLLGRDGRLAGSYASDVDPEDRALLGNIEKQLARN